MEILENVLWTVSLRELYFDLSYLKRQLMLAIFFVVLSKIDVLQ